VLSGEPDRHSPGKHEAQHKPQRDASGWVTSSPMTAGVVLG
jgi:hypothetical protein